MAEQVFILVTLGLRTRAGAGYLVVAVPAADRCHVRPPLDAGSTAPVLRGDGGNPTFG